jgi:hypothetical protein
MWYIPLNTRRTSPEKRCPFRLNMRRMSFVEGPYRPGFDQWNLVASLVLVLNFQQKESIQKFLSKQAAVDWKQSLEFFALLHLLGFGPCFEHSSFETSDSKPIWIKSGCGGHARCVNITLRNQNNYAQTFYYLQMGNGRCNPLPILKLEFKLSPSFIAPSDHLLYSSHGSAGPGAQWPTVTVTRL